MLLVLRETTILSKNEKLIIFNLINKQTNIMPYEIKYIEIVFPMKANDELKDFFEAGWRPLGPVQICPGVNVFHITLFRE